MTKIQLTNEEKAKAVIDALYEMYRESTPSLDLQKLPPYKKGEKQLNPNDYKLPITKFNEILKKHHITLQDGFGLFLNKSPKLIKDEQP